MIKNERQYRITKSQADNFSRALKGLPDVDLTDEVKRLEADALRSQLDDLTRELEEYDSLRAGGLSTITIESFDELPSALIKARIAAGLSQKELAERLGLKEQQVQRYEATDYESASLTRLREVVAAIGVRVRKEIFLPIKVATATGLFSRLRDVGMDKDFVLTRILPTTIATRLTSNLGQSEVEVRRAAATIGRVFNWETDEILGTEPLRLKSEPSGMARFKLPARTNERKLSAYTVYAHYLSLLVLQALPKHEPCRIQTDPSIVREQLISQFETITLESVLQYLWSLGVAVLPLADSGAFHGAFWRVEGRNIIVLKQRTKSHSRWIHDALHEVFHAGQEPDEPERSIIEDDEMSPARRNSDEEQEATMFASDVLLDCRSEDLAQMCVNAAGGRVQRLKAVVPMIARNEQVHVAALANYMAFRLSLQDINWWGTAACFQQDEDDPWRIARDWLVTKLNFDLLHDLDREILLLAFRDPESTE